VIFCDFSKTLIKLPEKNNRDGRTRSRFSVTKATFVEVHHEFYRGKPVQIFRKTALLSRARIEDRSD
jgi:hypothetical protein